MAQNTTPTSIRVPEPLLKKIDKLAKEQARSRSNMILWLLETSVAKIARQGAL
jgi:metal-responsive CopG/Arc/MetJ family transcriptional regulator